MKKHIILITIFAIFGYQLQGQGISGHWQGVLYQGSGPSVSYFPFAMTLNQDGNIIEGTSEARGNTDPMYFAIWSLEGTFDGTTFEFQEIEIIDQLSGSSWNWCIINGDLIYDDNLEKLEGPWEAPGGCNPGTLEIYKLGIKSDTILCSDEPVQLELIGQNVKWYADEDLTDFLHLGSIYTPTITATTTFYVTQTYYDIESPGVPITITINPTPVIDDVTSDQSGCEILNGAITISASGGTGQLEYSIDGINFQSSNVFDNLATGDYSVFVRDDFGCDTDESSISVISNLLPSTTISGNLEICEGESTTLQASGGTNFLWNNGEVMDSIIVNSSGTYSVILTDDFGCEAYGSVSVIVHQLPDVSIDLPEDTFCIDDMSLELSGGSPLGGIYSLGGVEIDSIYPSSLDIGVHTITYSFTDQNNCSDSAAQIIIVEDNNCLTSISATLSDKIKIFPNPASEYINISMDAYNQPSELRMYDIHGRLILTQKSDLNFINVSTFPKGVYYINIISREGEYGQKVVIN